MFVLWWSLPKVVLYITCCIAIRNHITQPHMPWAGHVNVLKVLRIYMPWNRSQWYIAIWNHQIYCLSIVGEYWKFVISAPSPISQHGWRIIKEVRHGWHRKYSKAQHTPRNVMCSVGALYCGRCWHVKFHLKISIWHSASCGVSTKVSFQYQWLFPRISIGHFSNGFNFVAGERPQLIEGCPKPIENLMTSCWDPSPINRPSMEHVVNVMNTLCEFFPGSDQPIVYSSVGRGDVCVELVSFIHSICMPTIPTLILFRSQKGLSRWRRCDNQYGPWFLRQWFGWS